MSLFRPERARYILRELISEPRLAARADFISRGHVNWSYGAGQCIEDRT
jgi:hypothetical protein